MAQKETSPIGQQTETQTTGQNKKSKGMENGSLYNNKEKYRNRTCR